MRGLLPKLTSSLLAATSIFKDGRSAPTIQIVGDTYLDILAKVDELPEWDGDASIKSPIETLAGGSALNTAVQLSALLRRQREMGGQIRRRDRPISGCTLHSRIGIDLYGDLVASRIREAGVRFSAKRSGGQGVCICLSGQTDRSFVSYKGSVAEFCEADLDMATLLSRGTRHVHFSAFLIAGLQPAVPPGAGCWMRRNDLDRAPVGLGRRVAWWMIDLLPHIDLLICNTREAAAIAGVDFEPAAHGRVDEAVVRLQDAGALVVVTLGAGGAIAARGSHWWYQPASPLNVVDTTGCGDAFAAGFLHGWCGTGDVQRGLVYGCACGTAVVGQMGGSSPLDWEDIEACMRPQDGVIATSSVSFREHQAELNEAVSMAVA